MMKLLDDQNNSLRGICEERIVVNCHNFKCNAEIYEGQRITYMGKKLFCNDRCLSKHLGAVTLTAREE